MVGLIAWKPNVLQPIAGPLKPLDVSVVVRVFSALAVAASSAKTEQEELDLCIMMNK